MTSNASGAVQGAPTVTALRVIPVAGHDGMLLNLFKGGLRALTGLISKGSPNAARIHASTVRSKPPAWTSASNRTASASGPAHCSAASTACSGVIFTCALAA